MNNGLRHFRNQCVAAGRSLERMGVGLSAFAMLALNSSLWLREVRTSIGWVMLAFNFWVVGTVTAGAGAGEMQSGVRGRNHRGRLAAAELRDWPIPALPVNSIARVAAEALAGLAVLVAWQLAFLVVASVLTTWDLVPTMRFLGLVDVVVLPMAAGWLLPARLQLLHHLRGAGATLIGAAAVNASISASSPLPVLLVSAVLTLVLFGTSDVAARIGDRSRRRVGGAAHGALARRSRPPLRQLWRDALLGPLESNRGVFYAAGGAALLAYLLGLVERELGIVRGGLIFAATVLPGFGVLRRPLGLGLTFVGGPSSRGAGGIFGGRCFAGGMLLPLRREWVARSFYLHVLVAGAVCVGLGLLAEVISSPFFGVEIRSAGIAGLPWPLALMVPSLGGLATASAMGDRRLRALSLTALLLTWPTAVARGVLVFVPSASGGMKAWLVLAIAVVLALVGGVPPLVYLFPRKRGAIRRP
jgi:hypothetical protein